jgi:hypothetical protein
MNRTIVNGLAITVLTLSATTAFAAGQKTALAHCGCNSDATDLEWKIINVSQSSKGHKQHQAGDIDTCVTIDADTGEELSFNFERAANDCTLIDGGELMGVAICSTDLIEGDSCSL